MDFLTICTAHQQNRDLDMFINASKNFNLNITWAASFSGKDIPREDLPCGVDWL